MRRFPTSFRSALAFSVSIPYLALGLYGCSPPIGNLNREENYKSERPNEIEDDGLGVLKVPIHTLDYLPPLDISSSGKNHQVQPFPQKTKKPKLKISVVPLSEYNPPKGDKGPEPWSTIERYYEHGFDERDSSIAPTDPEKFKAAVLKEAANLGYKEDRIKTLSPHQAVKLAAQIVGSKFNYYGEKALNALDELIGNEMEFIKNPKLPPIFKIVHISLLGSLSAMREEYSQNRSSIGGTKTIPLDGKPVDKLFDEEEIVCRHYARAAKEVYSILKDINNGLANTQLSCYACRYDHLWNQATAIIVNGEETELKIAFIDPTYSDMGGNLDAFDAAHFGGSHRSRWDSQLAYITKHLSLEFDLEVEVGDWADKNKKGHLGRLK